MIRYYGLKLLLAKFFGKAFYVANFWRLNQYGPKPRGTCTYNQIIYSCINDQASGERMTCYADKIISKQIAKYIAHKAGIPILIPTITDVFTTHEDLMDRVHIYKEVFVKSNHASQQVKLIKSPLEGKQLEHYGNQIRSWWSTEFNILTGEECYKLIPKLVYIEENICPADSFMTEVKVHCANGKPFMIQLISRYANGKIRRKTLDSGWNQIPSFAHEDDLLEVDPEAGNIVMNGAKALSEGLHLVRIDFYVVKKKVWFSEFTFYPCNACIPFKSKRIDKYWGKIADKLLE